MLYAEFFVEFLVLLLHIPADVATVTTPSSKSHPTEKLQLIDIIPEEEEENSKVRVPLPLYDWIRLQ